MFIGGDMATTRRYLDMTSRPSSLLLAGDTLITPININCLDPLGRSALLIGYFLKLNLIKIDKCFFLFI